MNIRHRTISKPAAGFQQARQFGNETGAVTRMRMLRTLPVFFANKVGGIGKQQLRRTPLGPRRQQSARMIEMQVAQHHHIDVLVRETCGSQGFQQHMLRFLHAVALAQLGLEERTDASLEQAPSCR